MTTTTPRRELFAIAFLILFFELAAIRWFGATVVFLTFFSNIVLLATFLGVSIGLLSAGGRRDLVASVLPLTAVTVALALAVFALYHAGDNVSVDVGGQQAAPQLVYFGADYRPADPSRWVVPMWAVGGAFFLLIALVFVGLGQAMGRAFAAIPDRVAAYTSDILGSLAGIAAFAAMSWLQLSPVWWFAVVVIMVAHVAGRTPLQLGAALATMLMVGYAASGRLDGAQLAWSPYYKVGYEAQARRILTNNIGHQEMQDIGRQGPAYMLPHLLNRDAGNAPFRKVLVIGAGSGNDVAAALRGGAQRVDAVEIDPRILELGRARHPNRPYDDARVRPHLDDGRSFVRGTTERYDLALYALVDSLVLHSGYSSLRLENFLFTREALEEVKRTLEPDGLFVMYNYYRQGWVVARLALMAQEAFGTPPIVVSLPYRPVIDAREGYHGNITFLVAGRDSPRLRALRERFAAQQSFWLHPEPSRSEPLNGFSPAPPAGDAAWLRIAPAQVRSPAAEPVPTDDWPQLYLRERMIPWAPIGQGMAVVALLSLGLLLAFSPAGRARPSAQMFFLGAGFMLLETKGVVHMALLFGSTWAVNAVVFFAILVMVLAANLYVQAVRPVNLVPYYALLLAGLMLNALVPMASFLSLEPALRVPASCLVVFVPVFFAGVVFSAAFRESRRPEVDFGSNIAGIVAGGLSEQLSLVVGFNSLLLLAMAYYLFALLLGRRAALTRPSAAPT
jgi:spermidine synthase